MQACFASCSLPTELKPVFSQEAQDPVKRAPWLAVCEDIMAYARDGEVCRYRRRRGEQDRGSGGRHIAVCRVVSAAAAAKGEVSLAVENKHGTREAAFFLLPLMGQSRT